MGSRDDTWTEPQYDGIINSAYLADHYDTYGRKGHKSKAEWLAAKIADKGLKGTLDDLVMRDQCARQSGR